jgi:hypothetical protein
MKTVMYIQTIRQKVENSGCALIKSTTACLLSFLDQSADIASELHA